MNAKEFLRAAFQGRSHEFPSLDGALEWLNSEPRTPDDLRGNVVLVQFWTYSCINWLRTLPYVRAWSEKYERHGLVTIGVHSPEFAFEKNVDDVRRATQDMHVDYPIAIDSDFAVWQAFHNQYWPALYFVDAQGQIRHEYFGEGEYEQSERILQELLGEAGASGIDHDLVAVDADGPELAADWGNLQSPESYLGAQRGARRAAPGALHLNQWALVGDWTTESQFAELNEPGGQIQFRFHARDLHLVMGPARRERPVAFRVLIDGAPPGAAHGTDVDEEGNGIVREPRLHQLVRQPGPITEHTFEITFADPGVQAYVFTFG